MFVLAVKVSSSFYWCWPNEHLSGRVPCHQSIAIIRSFFVTAYTYVGRSSDEMTQDAFFRLGGRKVLNVTACLVNFCFTG